MADDPDVKPSGATPFLSRWAQRKQADRNASRQELAAPAPDSPPPPPEPAFDPSTLPAIDDLTDSSDVRDFLRTEVPDALRKLALRKVWSLDPQIRDFREIAENQYDWNAVDGVPGFGPLPEGTDIGALLAQATGRIPAAEAEGEGEADAVPVAIAAKNGDVAADTVAASDGPAGASSTLEPSAGEAPARSIAAVRPDQKPESSGGISSDGTDPTPRTLFVRRQHGGALPVDKLPG